MVHIALYLSGWTTFYIFLNAVSSCLERRTPRLLFTWKKTILGFLVAFLIPLVMQSKSILTGDWCEQPKSVWSCMVYVSKSLGLKLKVHYAFSPFLYFSKQNFIFFSFLNCLYSDYSILEILYKAKQIW